MMTQSDAILAANTKDLEKMDPANPKYDRLRLSPDRLKAMANATENISQLPDPTDKVLLERTLDNDLNLKKVTVPLGVIGTIYEARPNVTIDIAALSLRSGNAVVLKGSRDADNSNRAIVKVIQAVLLECNLPAELIFLLPPDRKYAKILLTARDYVDVLIPRGSQSLINFVRTKSEIPVIETGAGVCHTYVHKKANIDQAVSIIINAKVSRPSVCNSLDTVLVDKYISEVVLKKLVPKLVQHKVEIWADSASFKILKTKDYPFLHKANQADFGREFLSLGMSIKIISDEEEALSHISQYSSKHSEAIITEDEEVAAKFLKAVDAACAYHNASTRFSDGEVFGLGAEIGISTQKLHARGPFALEKLVTEKWIIRGNGQIRL
jgi:glutamate-5-semialdehyde dehydrogenase